MRDYIVEMIATSKKQIVVKAKNAEGASKIVDLIIRNTDMVNFKNEDVSYIEVEIAPNEETDYEDNDVHFSQIAPKKV